MHQDALHRVPRHRRSGQLPRRHHPGQGLDGATRVGRPVRRSLHVPHRERSQQLPAVNRAWNNFYDNVDGIRDEFVVAWQAVAGHFAGRPEVAGYDILNEPENPRAAADLQPIYEDFLADSINGIRAAEAGAPFEHLIFIEPALPAADPSRGLVHPEPRGRWRRHRQHRGVGAQLLGVDRERPRPHHRRPQRPRRALTAGLGVPNWGGEYGFWDTEPETLAKVRRLRRRRGCPGLGRGLVAVAPVLRRPARGAVVRWRGRRADRRLHPPEQARVPGQRRRRPDRRVPRRRRPRVPRRPPRAGSSSSAAKSTPAS